LEPYTEQVVLLDGQAVSFPRNQKHPPQDSALAAGEALSSISLSNSTAVQYGDYGVPMVDGSIYMCFQNLFKIQPVFDTIITRILHADKDGHVILQASRSYHKTNLVQERIRAHVIDEVCQQESHEICSAAQDILRRIHFIPRVTSNELGSLFQKATVVLHPFPFGGSKTASDVLGSGVPLVTYPQRYLRGRLAATFYATMALHEIDSEVAISKCCVANDVADYVSKAVRLGTDAEYRKRVAFAIDARSSRIYDDHEVSLEWARFITRALGVSIKPEELALEMEYVPESWQTDSFHQKVIRDQQSRWKKAKLEQFILSQ